MPGSRVVLLLRHGETELNRAGALRGRLEVPLSENGRWQARRLAERIAAEYVVERIVASPLRRTVETAEAVSRATTAAVELAPSFVDVDYGSWAGRPPRELTSAERAEFERWRRDPTTALPGAEPPQAVQTRATEALEALVATEVGCAAVVSHDAVIQLVLCRLLGLPLVTYLGIAQQRAS